MNTGPTQACIDGLDPVTVDVVPLRPAKTTPHLELLGYRTPKGRSCGPVALNDSAATRIVWQAGTAAMVADPDGHWHQCER